MSKSMADCFMLLITYCYMQPACSITLHSCKNSHVFAIAVHETVINFASCTTAPPLRLFLRVPNKSNSGANVSLCEALQALPPDLLQAKIWNSSLLLRVVPDQFFFPSGLS